MQESPRRTVPRSAVSGLDGRKAGKPVVVDPEVNRSVEFISSLLDLSKGRIALVKRG
jgi:hypothetical protein